MTLSYVKLLSCLLPKKIFSLSEQVKSLTSEVALLKNQEPMAIANEVENSHPIVSSVEQSSSSPPNPPPSQDISKIITTVLSEEKEKEKRRLNLIIHNFKESQESDPLNRKEADINESTNII